MQDEKQLPAVSCQLPVFWHKNNKTLPQINADERRFERL